MPHGTGLDRAGGRPLAVPVQVVGDDESFARLQVARRTDERRGDAAPCAIDLQPQREGLDHPGAIREKEVVIEAIEAIASLKNAAEPIADAIGDRGVLERRVRRQPASPAQDSVPQQVLADPGEIAHEERDDLAVVEPLDAEELELLAVANVERALAAVPVAIEDERLRLGNGERSVAVELRLYVNGTPVKRLRLRVDYAAEQKNSEQNRALTHSMTSVRRRRPEDSGRSNPAEAAPVSLARRRSSTETTLLPPQHHIDKRPPAAGGLFGFHAKPRGARPTSSARACTPRAARRARHRAPSYRPTSPCSSSTSRPCEPSPRPSDPRRRS